MRAIYTPGLVNLVEAEELRLDDLDNHHLLNVLRLQTGEQIKLISGKGVYTIASIKHISKNELVVSDLKQYQQTKSLPIIHVYCAKVKRTASEEIVRKAVEIGVNSLLFIKSDRSQKFNLKSERISAIVDSAIGQSHNTFAPEISVQEDCRDLENVVSYLGSSDLSHRQILYASTGKNQFANTEKLLFDKGKEYHLFIGPEGGWSDREYRQFEGANNTLPVSIPSPIMRTETAVVAAVSYLRGLC